MQNDPGSQLQKGKHLAFKPTPPRVYKMVKQKLKILQQML